MQVREYTLRFLSPAFLGNAEQNAQWCTPPIKALLRQWWRVAYAADCQFKVDVAAMRREEGLLFGHAWLENDLNSIGKKTAARKSAVRIRLEMADSATTGTAWAAGTQKGVAPLATAVETGYAWFGLVNRGDGLADRNAIAIKNGEDRRRIRLAFPDDIVQRMETTLCLIHQFGQLGSRSRGGWGSFLIEGLPEIDVRSLSRFARSMHDCLAHDWPMSLGADDKGIHVWESKAAFPTWHDAMRTIAKQRRDVRTTLKSFVGRDLRPILGFASPGRMPSPLRWRITQRPKGQSGIRVFAMPSRIPEQAAQRISVEVATAAWQSVIQTLDGLSLFHTRTAAQQ